MTTQNYQVIDGRYIVLKSTVSDNNINITTEPCPFCKKPHFHGTGRTNWRDKISTIDGTPTWGHRVAHCVPREVEITLPDGTVVCNDDGYYLGIDAKHLEG